MKDFLNKLISIVLTAAVLTACGLPFGAFAEDIFTEDGEQNVVADGNPEDALSVTAVTEDQIGDDALVMPDSVNDTETDSSVGADSEQVFTSAAAMNAALETGYAADFSLSRTELDLGVGDTYDIKRLIVLPEDTYADSFVFSGDNASVAAVGTNGVLTAVSEGSATMTVTLTVPDGAPATHTLSVHVHAPAMTLKIVPSRTAIGGRMTGSFTVSCENGGYSLYDLDYDASAIEILSSDNGTYTYRAKAVRSVKTTTVWAVAQDGTTGASFDLTIYPAPAAGEIHFDDALIPMAIGEERTLTAHCDENRMCEFSYSSSNPSVADIDPITGKLHVYNADAESVTVTARDRNNSAVSASCVVQIAGQAQSIAFDRPAYHMVIGEQIDLLRHVSAMPVGASVSECTFVSDDSSVAAISANILSAVGVGTAKICATLPNGLTCETTVCVGSSPSRIVLSPAVLTVGAGAKATFTIAWEGSGSHYELEYDTGLIQILSITGIDSTDVVTFRACSVERITPTAINVLDSSGSVIAVLNISILPAPAIGNVYFEKSHVEIGLGDRGFVNPIHCGEGSGAAFTYRSSAPEYVRVNPTTGEIFPMKVTEPNHPVTITASAVSNPDANASYTVNVICAPESVYIERDQISIGVGEQVSAYSTGISLIPSEAITTYTFASVDESVAAVSEDGMITGVASGKTAIIVTTHNQRSALITVTVYANAVDPKFESRMITIGEGMRGQMRILHQGGYSGQYTVTADSDRVSVLSVVHSDTVDTLYYRANAVNTAADVKLMIVVNGVEKDSCAVHILPAPDAIGCDPETMELCIGETGKSVHPINTYADTMCDYSYDSSDASVAAVAADGTVTPVSVGTAVITIRASGSGASATCIVTVLPLPIRIYPCAETAVVAVGSYLQVPFLTEPANASCPHYSYAIGNTSIATIDAGGKIAGMSIGTTNVTVTASNGVVGIIPIEVVSYSSLNKVVSMAHRGASGYKAENTLEAFAYANELGADMIELDVHRTADGVIIVNHDPTINGYAIANTNYATLKASKSNLCTLDEALDYISGTEMDLMIEFKVTGIEETVIDSVERYNMSKRTGYGSFNYSQLCTINSLREDANTIFLIQDQPVINDVLASPQNYRFTTLSVDYDLANVDFIRSAHLLGYRVVAWTVNEKYLIDIYVNAGVDGITTNYPDRVPKN